MSCSIGLAGLAACLVVGASARADLVLDLPEISLAFNQANQTIALSAVNSGLSSVPLNGVLLNLQVADGGPAAGGSVLGPAITDVTVATAGTLFGNVPNTGEAGGGALVPQIYHRYTSTASGTVSMPAGPSVIAMITFDTTGVAPGDYTFAAVSLNGSSYFTDTNGQISPTLALGLLTVVPELDGTAVVTGVALTLAAPLLVRRRAARRCQA